MRRELSGAQGRTTREAHCQGEAGYSPNDSPRDLSPRASAQFVRPCRQRKILGRCVEGKPDAAQPVRSDQQIVVGDVSIVVPNESAVPRRPIGKNRPGGERGCGAQPGESTRSDREVTHPRRYYLSELDFQRDFETAISAAKPTR